MHRTMRTLVVVCSALALAGISFAALTPFQAKLRMSKAQCQPAKGYTGKLTPCYIFATGQPVKAEDCDSPKNPHCCLYECACILKGAGTSRGIVPKEYKLLTPLKRQVLKQCVEERKTPSKAGKAAKQSPEKATKPEVIGKSPKAPRKAKGSSKRGKKTSGKASPSGKPRKIAKTTTKPPTTVKPNRSSMFSFFNQFASILNGFGFNAAAGKANQ